MPSPLLMPSYATMWYRAQAWAGICTLTLPLYLPVTLDFTSSRGLLSLIALFLVCDRVLNSTYRVIYGGMHMKSANM